MEVTCNMGLDKELGKVTQLPETYGISQNYPNPFNPVTQIQYKLPEASEVKLTIYNILGEHVTTLINENQPAGFYELRWNGRNAFGNQVATGIYIYRMHAVGKQAEFHRVKKMLLLS